MAEYPTPADRVIDKLGGPARTAQITGKSLSTVYRWTWPRARGGTDGLIPADVAQMLLTIAKKRGLPLKPADFFEV